jgi:hypothetical protein
MELIPLTWHLKELEQFSKFVGRALLEVVTSSFGTVFTERASLEFIS